MSLAYEYTDRVFLNGYYLDIYLELCTSTIFRIVVAIDKHGNLALYYDIELKEKLFDEATGGTSIPTTTIITSDRDFMPVINNLNSFFDIKEGSKEFYVRYDLITDFTHDHGKKLL